MKFLLIVIAAGVIVGLAKMLSRSRSDPQMGEEWKQTMLPEHERAENVRSNAYWK
jgi:hypothetical protein